MEAVDTRERSLVVFVIPVNQKAVNFLSAQHATQTGAHRVFTSNAKATATRILLDRLFG
jgi:hypothetical protein